MARIIFLFSLTFFLFLMPMWVFGTDPSPQKEVGMKQIPPAVQRAVQELVDSWNEIMTTPVSMDMETFERRIREEKESTGINFDDEWIAHAKSVISDPKATQIDKNGFL